MFSWTDFPSRTGERRTLEVTLPQGSAELALHRYAPSTTDDDAGPRAPRPRLLLIHGFRGDHHGMQLIVDALPGYEIFVPDLPGFGETPPLRSPRGRRLEHTVERYAEVVEALAEQLRLGAEDVVAGHSFGSIVVSAHLQRAVRRWAGAVMLAPISDDIFRRPALLPGALGVELYYRLCQVLPGGWGDWALRSPLALAVTNLTMMVGREPDLRAYIRDQHRRHFGAYSDRKTVLEAYWASSRHTVTDYAATLDMPVLLLCGAKDQLSTVAGRRTLRQAVPGSEGAGAQWEILRGTGHLLHYEKPAQAGRAVERFLRSL
ncbi:alpha/beta fold hydrolase [Nesterenkonia cremea]|uniref:AB hydrolase-1 domain-containing protein n=1 Tax=Nesterenkonia cremea TaxID=1882340 RepID=A0A917AP22_9MICC|nr:alpha/beta hydrolase [Nesterenkonia cremea]GGE63463.1 hypothetical protein GCM10011401_08200 [Nesterenkonia cremea]